MRRPVTSESFLVRTQAEHPVHVHDGTDYTGVIACLRRLPRRALQASDALERQEAKNLLLLYRAIKLLDLLSPKK